ncbi:UNVERIFIED_CONTAM: U3 small nucleolar ribonucleoprotein IMP4 [Sesamum calycinum]|uniref:U3 small nucleolar ribonucleoprotein IMP4 n=1 Tax=Sesamum calycinum TaxID=2727403 RepID=A0AAW2SW57_9LAMI
MHHKKNSGATAPNMDGFGGSIVGEKALLLASVGRCPDDHAPDQGHTNPSGHQKLPETRLVSPMLSNTSPLEKSDAQDASDSRNLRVRIGKEKGRRRRKKKSSGMAIPGLFEVSSSQSSNSTPSSPLSPAASITPKPQVSPDTDHPGETTIPFSRDDKQECSRSSSKVNLLDNKISSRFVNNWRFSDQEKSRAILTRKLAGRAVLLPSATFPSAGTATHSPSVSSTSTISPLARAPGTNLHRRKADELTKEKFTYDIWGNHLFALPIAHQSKQSYSTSPGVFKNDSESFFVRDPQTLMKSSLPRPVSGNAKTRQDIKPNKAHVSDGIIISHLLFGPTAYFGLLNVSDMGHDNKKAIGTMPEAYPHLILDNFSTKLGQRTANILKYLFPVPMPDTKRIVTFANQSDYISFRHHIYEKRGGPKSIELKEIGPRFELRLYQIKLGTMDQDEAQTEWVIRPYMNTTKKRKFLGD